MQDHLQLMQNCPKTMHRSMSHTGRPSLSMRSWCSQSKPTIRLCKYHRTMTLHLRREGDSKYPPNQLERTYFWPNSLRQSGECYLWRVAVLFDLTLYNKGVQQSIPYYQDGHRLLANGDHKELNNVETSAWGVWISLKKGKKMKYRRRGKWANTLKD